MIGQKNDLPQLPKGWVWTQVGQIGEVILGQSPPSSTYNKKGDGLPFYQGKMEFGKIYPTPRKWCTAPKKIAEKGDVLISVRAPVGPTNICPEKSCIGRGLAAIRGLGGIDSFFILYLMRTFENVITGKGTGTTFKAIRGKQLREFEIPLPPLSEQGRIVAKIEELLTQLDAGLESLKKIKTQLKRYRQAILEYAFEGKLTAEWREQHKDELKPDNKLLEQKKKELEKAEDIGKKYKELTSVDTSNLSELPDGWEWTTIENVAKNEKGSIRMGPFGSQLKKAELTDEGVRVLWIENIVNNKFEYKKGKFITEEKYEQLKGFTVTPGELLITMMGTIGRVAIVPNDIGKAIISSHLLRIKLDNQLCEPKYLKYVILSENSKKQMDKKSRGVVMKGLNTKIIKSIFFPLPPLPEQHKIVKEIEHHLSLVDNIEKVVMQSLKQSERLHQSVLKKAFEGRLVPQDPNDEPAEKLLERIEENKAKQMARQDTNRKKVNRKNLNQVGLMRYVE